MKLTYFGHSAFQIETNDTTLLIDPFISGNPLAEGVVTAAELNPDFILLTHAHGDHWGDTPDIAKRSGAKVVGCFEIVSYLGSKHEYDHGHPTNTGGSVQFDWGRVQFTHARHSSSFPDGTYGGVANGLLLTLEGKTIYAAGDTSLFPDMEWIGASADIDLALIPIGDCFTMGPDDALKAVDMIKPGQVVPIHYNTFPYIVVSEDRLERWAKEVSGRGSEALVLNPGDSIDL